MKKIISLCIITVLLLSTMSISLASPLEKNTIAPETVITEYNIYDVLDYLGIDQERFIKSDEPLTNDEITVGELSEVIENAKNMPRSIKSNYVQKSTLDSKTNIVSTASRSSVRTVYHYFEGSFCQIGVSGSGEYSNNAWTKATGSNVFINSDDFGFTTSIIRVNKCEATVSGDDLKVDYKFTTESFFLLELGALSMGEYDYEGFVRFAP